MKQLPFKFCSAFLFAGVCCAFICLLQATADAQQTDGPKVVVTRLNAFGVPFKINADDGAFVEVQLYLSRDQGRTWSFFARQTTDKTEFPFQADGDGEYWFALKTLSRDRQLLPSGDPQPELKILIDTEEPKIDFRIQADPAGRVICRWQATDANLNPKSLKLLYQPVMIDGSVKPWQTVPVQLSGVARNGVYSDQVGWWPDTTQTMVNVAIEIQDQAGNKVRSDRRIKFPSTAWRNRSQSTTLPSTATTSGQNQQRNFKPIATNNSTTSSAGPPQQPDWAYPGWQPPLQPPPTDPKSKQWQTDSPIGKTASNSSHSSPSQKNSDQANAGQTIAGPASTEPTNIVCKDGVCVRVPAKKSAARDSISKHRLASNTPNPMQLVGSPEEFAAPPVPAGYVFPTPAQSTRQPPTRVAQAPRQTPTRQQDAIVWESDKENWQPLGSTNNQKFDATITPQPVRQTPASGAATDVPSNPGKMFYDGNKVIGQSSTKGPTNQYRGNQTIKRLPKSSLLPNYSTPTNIRQTSNRQTKSPQTNNRQIDSAPRNFSSRRPFSKAGFASPANPQAKSVVETSAQPNRKTRAPVQIIGSNRFRLNYGIDAIDPSGVDKVVLWVTRNDGQTWKTWGTDPDRRSPFPVETTEDGRYGFQIVVRSRDGLTGQGPSSGDDADIWITVDTEAPLVQITSVPYGRGSEAGRLVINFKASDSFLTLRPIKLSYAANPAGPWEVIQDGVRNEDRYLWKVGRDVPEQIFLKIEAVDRAGNVGVHILNQPVDVSGLVPRGTIHGVTPVGN